MTPPRIVPRAVVKCKRCQGQRYVVLAGQLVVVCPKCNGQGFEMSSHLYHCADCGHRMRQAAAAVHACLSPRAVPPRLTCECGVRAETYAALRDHRVEMQHYT